MAKTKDKARKSKTTEGKKKHKKKHRKSKKSSKCDRVSSWFSKDSKDKKHKKQKKNKKANLPSEDIGGVVLVKDFKKKGGSLDDINNRGDNKSESKNAETVPAKAKITFTKKGKQQVKDDLNAGTPTDNHADTAKTQPTPIEANVDGGLNEKEKNVEHVKLDDKKNDKHALKDNNKNNCIVDSREVTKDHNNKVNKDKDNKDKENNKPTEELTRKDNASPETKENDKHARWSLFAIRLLDGGNKIINNDFNAIKGYMPPAATRIDSDNNSDKNRFEDLICMDHSRVRLLDDTYINASWVDISDNRKAILTQLPLRDTSGDFWQMVLEQNVQAILLILSPYEYQTFNADYTFPKNQDFLHFASQHIRVGEFRRVSIEKHWTMHVLTISNGEQKRFIHVHHYSAWMHGQSPKNTQDLWQIQSVFRKYRHPHVYMSLSGCGRAGTYATFEAAHERLHADCHRLVMNDCVTKVRQGRLYALQRCCQLKTVNLALGEHILNNGFLDQMSSQQQSQWTELNK